MATKLKANRIELDNTGSVATLDSNKPAGWVMHVNWQTYLIPLVILNNQLQTSHSINNNICQSQDYFQS